MEQHATSNKCLNLFYLFYTTKNMIPISRLGTNTRALGRTRIIKINTIVDTQSEGGQAGNLSTVEFRR